MCAARLRCGHRRRFRPWLIAPSSIEALTENARFLAVNTQSNSANLGYNLITKYPAADYVCIDAPEARLAVSDRVSNARRYRARLVEAHIDCSKIIITQGKHGCVTFESGGIVHTIPAFAKNVVDTVGAGDAFFAVTAPLVAAGAPMSSVGFIGNVVGALKVEIVGHRRSIEKPALIKAITGLPNNLHGSGEVGVREQLHQYFETLADVLHEAEVTDRAANRCRSRKAAGGAQYRARDARRRQQDHLYRQRRQRRHRQPSGDRFFKERRPAVAGVQ